MFAFTSLGVHVDKSVNVGNGPYVFKICGVVCHKIGSLLPPADNPVPKFAQLYIYDTEHEIDRRMNIFSVDENELNETIPFSELQNLRSYTEAGTSSARGQHGRCIPREQPDPAIVDSLRIMLNRYN
jgi:hypothetical protein